MNETEISIKVKVFSDPEYCDNSGDECDEYCGYLKPYGYGAKCLLFDVMLKDYITKCDACKEALKQANK